MAGQLHQAVTSFVCAYCGEPLVMAAQAMGAWRQGGKLFCNEFCSDDGITNLQSTPLTLPTRQIRQGQYRLD